MIALVDRDAQSVIEVPRPASLSRMSLEPAFQRARTRLREAYASRSQWTQVEGDTLPADTITDAVVDPQTIIDSVLAEVAGEEQAAMAAPTDDDDAGSEAVSVVTDVRQPLVPDERNQQEE